MLTAYSGEAALRGAFFNSLKEAAAVTRGSAQRVMEMAAGAQARSGMGVRWWWWLVLQVVLLAVRCCPGAALVCCAGLLGGCSREGAPQQLLHHSAFASHPPHCRPPPHLPTHPPATPTRRTCFARC